MSRGTRRAARMLCLILLGATRGRADSPACPDRVFAASFDNGALFPWSNQTCDEGEPNDNQVTANTLCTNENGFNSSGTDQDFYRLANFPQGLFTFETHSGTVGQCNAIDTYLSIYDSFGSVLAFDDNSGVGNCSLLVWAPPASGGPFYLDVAGSGAFYVVATTVLVRGLDELEPNNDWTTATPYCTMAHGTIDEHLDQDYYSFPVTSGSTIQAQTNDGTAGSCTTPDTVVAIVDPSGVSRAAVLSDCSVVSFVADSTGTWSVGVWDFGQDEIIPLYGLAVTVTP